MFESPAYAATGGAAGAGAAGIFNMVFPLVAIFAIFYFLLIRPQQRRLKQHQALIGSAKLRDTVVTNGGLIGKVTKVDEHELEIEIAAGVRVRVMKTMLSDVRPHGAKAAND
jgi:preprotein translocase subunit YajC